MHPHDWAFVEWATEDGYPGPATVTCMGCTATAVVPIGVGA